jgi:hypothetical protein
MSRCLHFLSNKPSEAKAEIKMAAITYSLVMFSEQQPTRVYVNNKALLLLLN